MLLLFLNMSTSFLHNHIFKYIQYIMQYYWVRNFKDITFFFLNLPTLLLQGSIIIVNSPATVQMRGSLIGFKIEQTFNFFSIDIKYYFLYMHSVLQDFIIKNRALNIKEAFNNANRNL
jgi:hypothetical protein